ncbi:MAG TPA: HAD family phosphatase [Chloroflexota bacterium]
MSDSMHIGAIWDLDGTLVDTEANHYAAWRSLLQEHGRDLSYDVFRPTFGLRNDDVLVHHLGFGAGDDLAAMGARKEQFFGASLERDGVRMQPGARELVEHFHHLGIPQAIASSAPPANIDLIVRLTGLRDRFQDVVSSEQVRHGKPAPDIVLLAAQRLKISPARIVVLEDAPAGVEAGKAAGCRVIAIAAAFSPGRLAQADLVVRSFAEVLWPREEWMRFLTRQ